MEIINPSDNILDLGIFMSSNWSSEFHIQKLCKKCSTLSGWILRTFTTRYIITMMTLFKSLVFPRLDYGSKLWSSHLVKHIDQLEKIQRSFTKHITGMQSLEYSVIVSSMFGKELKDWFPIFLNKLFVLIQSAEEDHALFHM